MSPDRRTVSPFVAAGRRIHRVTVQNPGPSTPDGDGGYTSVPVVSPVPWLVAIDNAPQQDAEHAAAATILPTLSHVITGLWRADVSTLSSLVFNGRLLNVTAVRNPEERNVTLVCHCVEVSA